MQAWAESKRKMTSDQTNPYDVGTREVFPEDYIPGLAMEIQEMVRDCARLEAQGRFLLAGCKDDDGRKAYLEAGRIAWRISTGARNELNNQLEARALLLSLSLLHSGGWYSSASKILHLIDLDHLPSYLRRTARVLSTEVEDRSKQSYPEYIRGRIRHFLSSPPTEIPSPLMSVTELLSDHPFALSREESSQLLDNHRSPLHNSQPASTQLY